MTKYNLYATKDDWEKLYKEVEEAGFDVTPFKKSQSMDNAVVLFDAMKRRSN